MNVLLRIFAVLMGLRGITNVFKPLGTGSGLVFFGKFLPLTSPLGPVIGVYLLIYAYGLWTKKSWALPMGIAYAIFATINLVLFYVFNGNPEGFNLLGYLAFAVFGLGVSWGCVVLLSRLADTTRAA